jgi:hypothetical protein
MGGFFPPGTAGRLQQTPGEKGNPPGQYDPLPGDARRLTSRRRPGGVHRLLARLSFGRRKI